MNKIQSTPRGTTETDAQLAAFKSALMTGTPVSSGKGRSPAAVQEARSAGAQPVQTNANKVNTPTGPSEAPRTSENPGNTQDLTPSELYAERLENAELRRTVRGFSRLARVQKCMHTVRREVGVGVVYDYKAPAVPSGLRGLYTCGSVWACPRCGALIQRQRFLDVQQAMNHWLEKGGVIPTQHRDYGPEGKDGRGLLWVDDENPAAPVQGPAGYIDAKDGGIVWPGINDTNLDTETGELVPRPLKRFNLMDTQVKHKPGALAFMTLTLAHKAGGEKYAAAPIWEAEAAAFKGFTNDRFFKGNVPAYQRSVEVQWSPRAGWHIHIHVALFVSKSFKRAMKANRAALFTAWQTAVELQGYEAKTQGFDLRMVTDTEAGAKKLAQYVTKGSSGGSRSLAAEMTVNGAKKSVYSISPGQMRLLLHEARMGRESPAGTPALLRVPLGKHAGRFNQLLSAYLEFEQASRGKRWMTWSRGAKAAFGVYDSPEALAAVDSELDSDGDSLPENLNTGEIGGFKGSDWMRLGKDVAGPVRVRTIAEQSTDADDASVKMSAEFAGYIGEEEWAERLRTITARQETEAAKREQEKAPKWASGIATGGPVLRDTHGAGMFAEMVQARNARVVEMWNEEEEEPAEYYPADDYAA